MLNRLRQAIRNEDGQALVEMALVLPILMLVLFGVFDFGSAINDWNSTTSLANVGARYAAVGALPSSSSDPCSTNTTIQTYVTCEAHTVYHLTTSSGGLGFQGPVTVSVCTPSGSTAVGNAIQVTVSGNYRWIPVGSLGTKQISSSATMRLENAFPSTLSSTTVGSC